MSNNEKVIASLVGEVKFRVDPKPLQMFERMLDRVAAKMRAIERGIRPNIKGKGASPGGKIGTAAAGTAGYKAAAVQSGIVYRNESQRLKLAKAQAQLDSVQQTSAIRQSGLMAKLDQTAQQANLKAQQLQQRLETSKLGKLAAANRLQATGHRTKVAEVALERANLRLQHQRWQMQQRMQKALSGSGGFMGKIKGALSGKATSGALAGSMAAGAGIGAADAGLSLFAGRIGIAASSVAALGAAAVGAIAGLKAFGDRSVGAASQGNWAESQFRAVNRPDGSESSTEDAKGMRQRMQDVFDENGINERTGTKSYSKGILNSTDAGMSLEQAEGLQRGLLKYGKGAGLDDSRLELVQMAISQVQAKGRLQSEEYTQQIAEHLPGINKLSGAAWAEVTKSGKKGEEAIKQFMDDMLNGLIAGADRLKWLNELAKQMEADANRGGRLDAAKSSPESQQNRIDNINTRNLEKAANHNNKELLESHKRLGDSRATFTRRLEGLFKAAAPMSADVNRNYAAFLDGAGNLAEGIGESIQDIQEKIKALEASEGAADWEGANQQLEILSNRLGIAFDGTGNQLENLFARIGYFADKFPIAFVENTAREINGIIDFFDRAFSLLGRFADWLYNLPMSIVDKVSAAMQQLGAKLETISNDGTGIDYSSMNRDIDPSRTRKPEDFARDTQQRMQDAGNRSFKNDINVTLNSPININGSNADPSAIAENVRSRLKGSIESDMRNVFDTSMGFMLSSGRANAAPAR